LQAGSSYAHFNMRLHYYMDLMQPTQPLLPRGRRRGVTYPENGSATALTQALAKRGHRKRYCREKCLRNLIQNKK
jgi:hypothetical protein